MAAAAGLSPIRNGEKKKEEAKLISHLWAFFHSSGENEIAKAAAQLLLLPSFERWMITGV